MVVVAVSGVLETRLRYDETVSVCEQRWGSPWIVILIAKLAGGRRRWPSFGHSLSGGPRPKQFSSQSGSETYYD